MADDVAGGQGAAELGRAAFVDTGSKPRDITHYLTKPTAGRIITETLAGL